MKGLSIRLRYVIGACAAALTLGACGGGLPGDEAAAGASPATASQAQGLSECSGGTCRSQQRIEENGAIEVQTEEAPAPEPGWVNACTGLVPTLPTWRIVDTIDLFPPWSCGNGTSDGHGTLALEKDFGLYHINRWDLLPVPGGARFTSISGYDIQQLLPQPSGFLALSHVWYANQLWFEGWAHDGTPRTMTRIDYGSGDVISSRRWTDAPDPNGGALVLYTSVNAFGNHWFGLQAWRFNTDGTLISTKTVTFGQHGYSPAFMVGGVGKFGESLVVFDSLSAEFELPYNRIAAVWLDREGNPLTPFFDAGPALQNMGTAQLELAPLSDGSLVLQVNGKWVLRFPRRAKFSVPAPGWLASRPDTKLAWIHQGQGYVLLPRNHESVSRCQQTAVIFGRDGTFCGALVFKMNDQPCTTEAIDVGWDGTVIQQLPAVSEPTGANECTRQWWPRLLK